MQLGDLLAELRENILHDRSNRVAGDSDLMWSDATLVRYINEAQKRFAREGLVIRDANNGVTASLALQTDVDEYACHPSVLAVISARITGDQADLARTGHSALDQYRQPDPHFFDVNSLSRLESGKPLAFTTDEYLSEDSRGRSTAVTVRFYPTPNADYNGTEVKLRVLRMPVYDLTTADMCAEPEIPEVHHLEMLDWAAYLALRVVDLDAGMPDRAMEFRASFEDHVRRARRAAMRKLFAPHHWGFGRNGFVWDQGHG